MILAVEQLGELVDEMVFLGGCATGLLITDPAAPFFAHKLAQRAQKCTIMRNKWLLCS